MPSSRSRNSSLRPAVIILAATLGLFLLYKASWPSSAPYWTATTDKMTQQDATQALSKLSVSLKQTKGHLRPLRAGEEPPPPGDKPRTAPITLTVTVTNKNAFPVTILTWDSPLEWKPLGRGLLQITPSGEAAPLDLPRVEYRRVTPPGDDALVEIAPGKSVEREVELESNVAVDLSAGRLFGAGGDGAGSSPPPPRVVMKGEWACVWPFGRGDINGESLEMNVMAGDSLKKVEFVSNEVALKQEI